MTELVSMLVPLQGTLPGWPAAQQPSAVEVLGLLFGIPIVVIVIISVIGHGRDLIRSGRGEDRHVVSEPLWLGAAPADRAAVTSGAHAVPTEGRRAVTSSESASTVGGASVRW